jgi:hypothetical protein
MDPSVFYANYGLKSPVKDGFTVEILCKTRPKGFKISRTK